MLSFLLLSPNCIDNNSTFVLKIKRTPANLDARMGWGHKAMSEGSMTGEMVGSEPDSGGGARSKS